MSEHQAYLPRYKHLRQVGTRLNTRLVKTLSRDEMDQGARELGLLHQGVMVFDSEDEMSVLMDYCLHDVRRGGRNAIERFLEATPPPPGSDERIILEALRDARYTLVAVERTEPGVGVHVDDLFFEEPLFLMDVGFSNTAVPGAVLATRLKCQEGQWQTTGAALPVGRLTKTQQKSLVEGFLAELPGGSYRTLSREQASNVARTLIGGLLKKGAAEHIAYAELGGALPGPRTSSRPAIGRRESGVRASGRVGRNDPCPCGSGKKFKHCCMRS
jgi:hypothetical protein